MVLLYKLSATPLVVSANSELTTITRTSVNNSGQLPNLQERLKTIFKTKKQTVT